MKYHFKTFQIITRILILSTIVIILVILYKNSSITYTIIEHEFENLTKNDPKPVDHLKYRKELINQLQPTDYVRLVNLTTFTYTIFNRICHNQTLYFISIHSKPSNFQRRMDIRNTWGNKSITNVSILFFLGLEEKLENQGKIDSENEKYNDIIQGNYIDSYYNLTYKHASVVKYFVYYCPKAIYNVKIDDDVFVNIPAVNHYLGEVVDQCTNKKNLLLCHYPSTLEVARSGKWGIETKHVPSDHYPQHCIGIFIAYYWDVAFKIYEELQKGDFFKFDDVYLTGFLTTRAGIMLQDVKPFNGNLNEIQAYVLSNGTKGRVNFLTKLNDRDSDTATIWNFIQKVPDSRKFFNLPKNYCV